MKKNSVQSVSVYKLQSQVSKIIREVEKGNVCQVMRYSKPVAVIMSHAEYKCLTNECRGCVRELVNELNLQTRKKNKLSI
jgi:prevent-host-death family protein